MDAWTKVLIGMILATACITVSEWPWPWSEIYQTIKNFLRRKNRRASKEFVAQYISNHYPVPVGQVGRVYRSLIEVEAAESAISGCNDGVVGTPYIYKIND